MPRTVQQNQKIKTTRKEAILKAALELFAKNGFDSVSTDNITSQVGCSHGLFYHYFKDKNEVFDELLHRARTKDKLLLNQELESYHGISAIEKVATTWCKVIESTGDEIYYFHMFLISHFQKTLSDKQKMNSILYNYLKDKVTEGQEAKEIAGGSPEDYVNCFLSMFEGLSFSSLFATKKKRKAPDIDIIMNLFKRKVTFNV